MRSPFVEPARGFDNAEYELRLTKAQSLMDEQGIDALLLMTEAEVRYFSGFQTLFWQSPTRPWFLVVPGKGKPIAIVPNIGAQVMADQFVDQVLTWSSPNPSDDGISLLASTLHEVAGASGRIGLPMGPESSVRMPLQDLDAMRAMQDNSYVNVTELISSLRMIKSDAEILKVQRAAQIASHAFANAHEVFHVGQPLIEAFRAFKIECLRQGADDVPYLVGGADHGGYRDIISSPTKRPLTVGDVLMLDTGVTFDGYYCDFDRNFSVGPPSERTQHAHHTLWDATETGKQLIRPGVRCQEVFSAMNNVITRAGYQAGGDVGRYGHGLGMQLTEWPSIATFDRTILKQNMIVTLEPSLVMENGLTMVHEENVVIGERGCEYLSTRVARDINTLPG